MRATLITHPAIGRAMLLWTVRIAVAVILLPYAYLKLAGSDEWVFIFQMLGADPAGRYLTAALEIATVLLLMVPRTSVQGALTGIVVMLGALGAHLFVLGIEVRGDHGGMFFLALFTLACLVSVLLLRDTSKVAA